MPVVSVIIPAYNAEAFLHLAIESALGQSLPDCEVIVVDDGSSDGTAEVVRRYPSVRLIQRANGGVASARNQAVRESQGEFIAFLDADDRWHPDKLRCQVDALRRHSGAVLCRTLVTHDLQLHEAMIRDRDPERVWPERVVLDLDESFLNPFFGTPAVMVRRKDFLRVGGFDEMLKVSEDIDFFLRVLVDHPELIVIEAPLTYVDLHDEGLSADGVGGYRQLLQVYRALVASRPDSFRHRSGLVRQALSRLELRLARALLQRGDRAEALGQAGKAWCRSPSLASVMVMARSLLPSTGKAGNVRKSSDAPAGVA